MVTVYGCFMEVAAGVDMQHLLIMPSCCAACTHAHQHHLASIACFSMLLVRDTSAAYPHAHQHHHLAASCALPARQHLLWSSMLAAALQLQNGYSCARGGASFNNLPASLSSPALSKVYQYSSRHLLRCYPGGALMLKLLRGCLISVVWFQHSMCIWSFALCALLLLLCVLHV
jgi:hypothetical protein